MRQLERVFVIEGAKLVTVALDAGAPIEALYYDEAAVSQSAVAAVLARAEHGGVRAFALAAGVLARVADTVTPQPLCAVVSFLDRSLEELAQLQSLVVLVEVRDPGNVGAIIRSADAAGIDALISCEKSADLYNPKTVRATAGSIFHLPVLRAGEAQEVLSGLGAAGFSRIGAVAHGGLDYQSIGRFDKVAIVLGNEAQGIGPSLLGELDLLVTIPIAGGAESLNVAMASTILCFELARQKKATASKRSGTKTL